MSQAKTCASTLIVDSVVRWKQIHPAHGSDALGCSSFPSFEHTSVRVLILFHESSGRFQSDLVTLRRDMC